jgi:hypothetical protein
VGRGVFVGGSVGAGVSVRVGVNVGVKVGLGVDVSAGRKFVDVKLGGWVGEAGVAPVLFGAQADVIRIKMMKRKNLICFIY